MEAEGGRRGSIKCWELAIYHVCKVLIGVLGSWLPPDVISTLRRGRTDTSSPCHSPGSPTALVVVETPYDLLQSPPSPATPYSPCITKTS